VINDKRLPALLRSAELLRQRTVIWIPPKTEHLIAIARAQQPAKTYATTLTTAKHSTLNRVTAVE
jgi:hypothetical protein